MNPTENLEQKLREAYGNEIDITILGGWIFFGSGAVYPACHQDTQTHVVPYFYPHGVLEMVCGYGTCTNRIVIDLIKEDKSHE